MTNILVPELGESVVEARVARWLKRQGDRVTVGEPLVELETEKVDLEVGASQTGVLATILRGEGEDVKIGDVLGTISSDGAGVAAGDVGAAPPVLAPVPSVPAEEAAGTRARATPTARRLAEEHAVDVQRIRGSGLGGRVTRDDVKSHVKARPAAAPSAPAVPTPSAPPAESLAGQRGVPGERREERVRLSKRRLTIARRLVEAQRTAAMLTTFNEIDMTAVQDLRRRHKERFRERHGVGLGLTSFFVKASVAALQAYPKINAEMQGDEMVLKHYYDIGVAVGASGGLVVPVLRDADRLSFAEIEGAVKDFARRAEDGTLTLEDLRGGTFTITNGGIFGSLMSTPILNPPQVGILGLHKIEDRAVAVGGQVTIRPMMYVALSYDHRLVDGLEAVQYLVRVKQVIEDPISLLLEK